MQFGVYLAYTNGCQVDSGPGSAGWPMAWDQWQDFTLYFTIPEGIVTDYYRFLREYNTLY